MTPSRRRDVRRPWCLVVAVTTALLPLAACDGGDRATGPLAVEVATADGEVLALADFGGSPLIVNLWATWCTPCLVEMPAFDAVAAAHADITVIGVNVGETAEVAVAFAADLGIGYRIVADRDGALSSALGVNGLPATAFITREGKIVEVHQGALTAEELERAIDDAFRADDT